MVNENALRDALLALAQDGKSNYLMISSLLAELAALRETVRGLDPTFGDVMEQERERQVALHADTVRSVVATYDEIIQRVMSGEVC